MHLDLHQLTWIASISCQLSSGNCKEIIEKSINLSTFQSLQFSTNFPSWYRSTIRKSWSLKCPYAQAWSSSHALWGIRAAKTTTCKTKITTMRQFLIIAFELYTLKWEKPLSLPSRAQLRHSLRTRHHKIKVMMISSSTKDGNSSEKHIL